MKIADTISVNPSKTTLGQVETASDSIFRRPVVGVVEDSHAFNFSKILFPSLNEGTAEYKKYDVPLRTLFATILIATGITLLESSVSIALGVCSLCFGGFLALGLLTRPVMLAAAVYYCITGALSLRSGNVDLSVFSLMFGSLIFAVIGAGKYSCDFLLKRAIVRRKRNCHLKLKENMMGYKAFHSVKF